MVSKFIANIDGPDVRVGSTAHVSSDLGKPAVHGVKGLNRKPQYGPSLATLKAAKKPAKPKPKAKTTVKQPVQTAPKPVTSAPAPTKPTSGTTVAKPATATATGQSGASLGMIALAAGGLFLVAVLLGRKRR